MRLAGMLGVLCFAVAPAFGGAVNYTFQVTSGTLAVDTSPDGVATPDPVTVNMAGTFGMVIYQASDQAVGASDTFVLGASNAYNTELVELSLMGLATAKISPGSAGFKDFAMVAPGHVGNPNIQTDVYLDIVAVVSGLLNTTLDTKMWAEKILDFQVTVPPTGGSQTLTVNIQGTFGFEIGVTAITQTLTLDLIVNIVGTAHVVPDPALGGLTALGLGGAGAWIRRRRD